jgi:hypothetical protein
MIPFHQRAWGRGSLRWGLWVVVLLGGCPGVVPGSLGAAGVSSVDAWLSAQTNLVTWAAEVVQVRRLATVAQPLVSTGRVWFVAPDRFRWELGVPASTIALRQADQLLVVYPRLRRVERYGLGASPSGAWAGPLALLEAGFPRSRAALDARFRLVAEGRTNDVWMLELEPRDTGARRLMRRVRVELGVAGHELRATEMEFADGSSLRNEFLRPVRNGPVDPALLDPVLDPGYERVEPLRPRGRP